MSHPTSRRFYRGPRQEPGQTRHPHSSRVAYVGATITKGTSASKFAPPDLGHGATVIEGPSAGTLIPSDFGDGSTDIEGPSAFTPAPSNFGDGITVIEGPSPSTGNADARAPSGSTVDKEAKSSFVTEPQSTFAEMSDYFSEERPFVVLMEEKGVIGALQILDQRLRTVCVTPLPSLDLFGSALKHGALTYTYHRLQAGYDKILSSKVCRNGSAGWQCPRHRLCALIRKTNIAFFFCSAYVEAHTLDRQEDRARTDRSHESGRYAKTAYETRTLFVFPAP